MPKYYCEYCDINLTHSSPAGRRQHNSGRRHISNKIEYYQQLLRDPNFKPPAYLDYINGGPPGPPYHHHHHPHHHPYGQGPPPAPLYHMNGPGMDMRHHGPPPPGMPPMGPMYNNRPPRPNGPGPHIVLAPPGPHNMMMPQAPPPPNNQGRGGAPQG